MKAVSPTGARIVGTVERIPGVARISRFYRSEQGRISYDYEGETDVNWDGQETVVRDGKEVFEDENGEEWTEDQITLVEEGEDDNVE